MVVISALGVAVVLGVERSVTVAAGRIASQTIAAPAAIQGVCIMVYMGAALHGFQSPVTSSKFVSNLPL